MSNDQERFLMLRHLPGRLTADQAAWMLNCQPHDIPALVAARLLKPLGKPAGNCIKFFRTAEVLEGIQDRQWLARVSATIYEHWHKKNTRQKEPTETRQDFLAATA